MTVTGYVVVVKDEPIPGVPSYRAYGVAGESEAVQEMAESLRDQGKWAEAMPLRNLEEALLEL